MVLVGPVTDPRPVPGSVPVPGPVPGRYPMSLSLSYLSGFEMYAARSELYIPVMPGSWLLWTVSTTNTDAFFCPKYNNDDLKEKNWNQ